MRVLLLVLTMKECARRQRSYKKTNSTNAIKSVKHRNKQDRHIPMWYSEFRCIKF